MPPRVLIIGGGLAGPCLALSLARRNIPSTIFEIRQTRSDAGGSISLGPNALRVLDRYARVYPEVQAAGYSYHRFGAYTDGGEKLGEIQVGEDGEGGYPAIRIMRSRLHGILLDAAGGLDGMVDVKYGARMTTIEEDEEGVTVSFEDGSVVKGDIVIGCDGVHSKVREHVLGDDSPTPTFDGICVVNGFVPAAVARTPSPEFTFPAFMFTSTGLFMTIPIDPKGETLAWGINTTMADRSRTEWAELERSGEAARLAKANYADTLAEPVRSLLDNADDTRAKLWAPSVLPDIPRWHTARVLLIGDAAHGLPPNGQGSAMAFEDAAILTRLIASKGDESYEQLFAKLEAVRRPRIDKLRNGKAGGMMRSKTGPLAWYLKKWAFRGFFWWNSGVLQHVKDSAFDVDQVDIAI